MLQTIGNAETRRIHALFSAVNAQEITAREFSDALYSLPSEIAQIAATVSAIEGANCEDADRLRPAIRCCYRFAARTRALN